MFFTYASSSTLYPRHSVVVSNQRSFEACKLVLNINDMIIDYMQLINALLPLQFFVDSSSYFDVGRRHFCVRDIMVSRRFSPPLPLSRPQIRPNTHHIFSIQIIIIFSFKYPTYITDMNFNYYEHSGCFSSFVLIIKSDILLSLMIKRTQA